MTDNLLKATYILTRNVINFEVVPARIGIIHDD